MKIENRPFYASSRWKRARNKAIKRDRGLCVRCKQRGIIRPGQEVDHIKPVHTHPRLAFKLSNLQYLCRSCHVRKTNEDERGGPIDICEHGYPEGVCCIAGVQIPRSEA